MRTVRRTRFFVLLVLPGAWWGCTLASSPSKEPLAIDATPTADAGHPGVADAAATSMDAAHPSDAAAPQDASALPEDAATTSDATSPEDSGTDEMDAATVDASGLEDASTLEDAASATDADTPAHDAGPRTRPPPPQLQFRGGAILSVPVFTAITYDSDELQAELEDYVAKLGTSGDAFWTPALSEYGVGPATVNAPVRISSAAPAVIDDLHIQTWIQQFYNQPGAPQPTAQDLLVFFLPSDTQLTNATLLGCRDFGAYHSSLRTQLGNQLGPRVAYAVMPRCEAGTYALFYTTVAATHEITSAVTDPDGADPHGTLGWWGMDDDHRIWEISQWGFGGEHADVCEGFHFINIYPAGFPYGVQRVWSNAAARAGQDPCVPHYSGETYFVGIPILEDSVDIHYGQSTVRTKGARIPLGESRTIEVLLHAEHPNTPAWTVTAMDLSTLGWGKLGFSWDRASGVSGDVLHLTITNHAGSTKFGGAPFIVEATDSYQRHRWYGYVSAE